MGLLITPQPLSLLTKADDTGTSPGKRTGAASPNH
jgi:hypothetical protein